MKILDSTASRHTVWSRELTPLTPSAPMDCRGISPAVPEVQGCCAEQNVLSPYAQP